MQVISCLFLVTSHFAWRLALDDRMSIVKWELVGCFSKKKKKVGDLTRPEATLQVDA